MLQLLSPERVAIASTEPAQHAEVSVRAITPQAPTPTQNQLKTNRIGLLDVASATANTVRISDTVDIIRKKQMQ